MSNKSGTSIITQPSGGGALKGLGEKFSPDLFTGTGNYSVPISLPPGRNGFQPELNLQYSTGSPNSPWGLGWSLGIPGVMRQTTKGIPKYQDDDIFILSGAEDLIPVDFLNNRIQYRPRTEGLFAKIYHYLDENNDYWEVKTKEGLISYYGTPNSLGNDPAACFDPQDTTKIANWRLSKTVDVFGNVIEYDYRRDIQETKERNWNQLYLSQIKYIDYGSKAEPNFLVTVELEYKERPDAFSTFRQGFEVRTTERCKVIKIYNHDTPGTLVKRYDFTYLDERVGEGGLSIEHLPLNGTSLLSQIEVKGRKDDEEESYPPLEFGYSQFQPQKREFEPIKSKSLPNVSLANPNIELADLFGNGLPDIVEIDGIIRYWRNMGNGEFDMPKLMNEGPGGLFLGDSEVQLIDADGDARVDLMVNKNGLSGYFPSRFGANWDERSFQKYDFAPSFSFQDPEVQLLDLTGDGVTDIIRSGSRLECYFNDAKKGWHDSRQIPRQQIDSFPNINFSDPRLKWADMTGDNLQDIVLIHNGNVEYWANKGYGNFSKKIHMRNSPRFPYGFDYRRILVGDVDGDGLADIVYVDNNEITLWINQSGNAWSDPITIKGTPRVTDTDAVRLEDLFGTGIRGVLWTADKDGQSRYHYHFLDFTGGVKPYLLTEMNNNMGALTKVAYRSSIQYYLEDEKRLETRWKTTLPFPVQTVSRVEVIDQISQGKLTTEYHYKHGYWDGGEREFRGFGRVDQFDSEVFHEFNDEGLHEGQTFNEVDLKFYTPPLKTSTWFHLGAVGDEFGDWEEVNFENEYWQEDNIVFQRDNDFENLLISLPRRAKRDAFRTLRGRILRTELYAIDGSILEARPYTVSENNYAARLEFTPDGTQDLSYAGSGHIFFPFSLAQRTTQWERGNEPMTQIAFTADYDAYGNPESMIEMGIPRGRDFTQKNNGAKESYLIKFTSTKFANPVDNNLLYLVGKIAKVSIYNVPNDGTLDIFKLRDDILTVGAAAAYDIQGQTFTYYDGNAYQGLPFKQIGQYGIPTRVETLILTDEIVQTAYNDIPLTLIPNANPPWTAEYPNEFRNTFPNKAGYIYRIGANADYTQGYYSVTQQNKFDFQDGVAEPRGVLLGSKDPMGNESTITPDKYQLLPIKVVDPKGLEVTAEYDYRFMQAKLMTDPNGNRTGYDFSPLGLLTKTAVMGKAGTNEGDTLVDPSTLLEYGYRAFYDNEQPIFVKTIKREHHIHDGVKDDTIQTIEYSDGFGRLLQTRTQAEDVLFGNDAFGDAGLAANQDVPNAPAIGTVRNVGDPDNVIVSGWQIYNNKGKVVEKYEPFFDKDYDFNAPQDSQLGHRITMYYDPRGNVIRTLNPNGSEQRVIFGVPNSLLTPDDFMPTPWESYTYDANDLAPITHPTDTSVPNTHHYTPSHSVIDALGRTVISTSRNGQNANEEATVRYQYDIRGNILEVTDPLNRVSFRHIYDLTPKNEEDEENQGANVLNTWHLDGGTKTTVYNALGNPVEMRNEKGCLVLNHYDALNRPINMWARDKMDENITLRQHLIYGEDSGYNPENSNLKGLVYKQYDEAGLVTIPLYDFKGNIKTKIRQVISDDEILGVFNGVQPQNVTPYRIDWSVDWNNAVAVTAKENQLLDAARDFQTDIDYDALNRAKKITYPRDVDEKRKELTPSYNRAGNLEKINLAGTDYVQHIAYNAKGQRLLIAYGNSIMTRYVYEPQTFRLMRLRSEKYQQNNWTFQPQAGSTKQDYAYEYDLVGNIIRIKDRTPNSGVSIANGGQGLGELTRNFAYDPLYRLIQATGRECKTPPPNPIWDDTPRCNDPNLTRGYTRDYKYDLVGNMERMQNPNGFNKTFTHTPNKNTLQSMNIGQNGVRYNYQFDVCGNMEQEGSSRFFEWDYRNQLRAFFVQPNPTAPHSKYAHYCYNSDNERVKKVVQKQRGQVDVTIYIDGLLDYQYTKNGGGIIEGNNTIHILDDERRIATLRVGNAFEGDATPSLKYNLNDHLGSSSVIMNLNGTTINREEYYPFGGTSYGSFSKKRYRFIGKEKDLENGFYYLDNRYLSTVLYRFISIDPLKSKFPKISPFIYARNRVLTGIDKSGLEYLNITEYGLDYVANSQEGPPTEKQSKLLDFLSQEGIDFSNRVSIGGKTYIDTGRHLYFGANGWSSQGTRAEQKTVNTQIGIRLQNNIANLPNNTSGQTASTLQQSYNFANIYIDAKGLCYAVTMARIQNAFENQGINNALNLGRGTVDYALSATLPNEVPFNASQYLGFGVGGALARNGRANLVTNVWNGDLQQGAPLQIWWNYNSLTSARNDNFSHGGHSVIFDSYQYDANGNIIGLNYSDFDDRNGSLTRPTNNLVVGANLID